MEQEELLSLLALCVALTVSAIAQREGLDLAECAAYSDSSNDIPMLETVGHAIAVNPDRELARVARERGWEIIPLRQKRRA